MPVVKADTLEEVTYHIFRGVNMPEEDARITARLPDLRSDGWSRKS